MATQYATSVTAKARMLDETRTVGQAIATLYAANVAGRFGMLTAGEWVGELESWGVRASDTYIPTGLRQDIVDTCE